MRCKYLDQDFEARMHGGMAYYDGKPVLLHATRGAINIQSFPNGDNIKQIVKTDELLDLSSPVLGYVNFNLACVYTYRKPERKYKQTLTYGAIGVYDPTESKTARWDQNAVFYTEEFKNMLMDKYPKLDEVIKSLNGKVVSRAISRDVALAKDSFGIIRVYYKFDEVGHITPGSMVVNIPSNHLAWVVSKYLETYVWKVV